MFENFSSLLSRACHASRNHQMAPLAQARTPHRLLAVVEAIDFSIFTHWNFNLNLDLCTVFACCPKNCTPPPPSSLS